MRYLKFYPRLFPKNMKTPDLRASCLPGLGSNANAFARGPSAQIADSREQFAAE